MCLLFVLNWINRQSGIPYFFFCARIREVGFARGISSVVWIERLIMSDADKLKARLRVVISNSQSIKESDNYLDSPVGEKKMELSRQRMREQILNRFKFIKTCVLARELCLLVRTNRVTFNQKDAHDCCAVISKLCQEAGCKDPSALCSKAAEAVLNSEKKYLDICGQSCIKCGESRQPASPRKPIRKSNKNIYVA
jgi:hypothetical protein